MTGKWEVTKTVIMDAIRISVEKDGDTYFDFRTEKNGVVHVSEPNYLEMILGITLEQKIQKAVKKQEKFRDKLNRFDIEHDKFIEQAKKILANRDEYEEGE